jgi:hypothetical protein
MRGISLVAEKLLAAEEGLSFLALFLYLVR